MVRELVAVSWASEPVFPSLLTVMTPLLIRPSTSCKLFPLMMLIAPSLVTLVSAMPELATRTTPVPVVERVPPVMLTLLSSETVEPFRAWMVPPVLL